VPPRPNKDLIRERLLYNDVKKNSDEIESIDEKKENRYFEFLTLYSYISFNLPLNSEKPDIVLDLLPSVNNSEKKRSGIIIDYSKFRRPPRVIGDYNDEISFCCPSGVAVSKTGLIYVADQQNQCVKVIPLLGSEKQILSRPFNRPKGIHVDELGRVLVTEHNRLLILDNELNLLKAIGEHGSKPGEFNVPWGKIN